MYRTKDQVAQEFIAEGRRRGITPRGMVICIATGLVESNLVVYANSKVPESLDLPHDAVGSDGRSVGPLQQQVVWGNGWWWGDAATCMDPTKSAGLFYDRLAKRDYNNGDPGTHAQAIQGSAFPDRYAQRMADAQAIYDRLAGGAPPPTGGNDVGVSGDPTWLEEVLRPVLGDRLKTLPGWQDSGVGGTMQQIWGVIWHHTGNASATAQSIRDGRSDLQGPLSQLHIAQDGTVTIVAVGPCNHAGVGSWVGLPTDNANDRTIGIECAFPRDTSMTEATQDRERWPDAQMESMIDVGAALARHLGYEDGSHNIAHKEWARFGPAGYRQGKWDPANLEMNWFRQVIKERVAIEKGQKPPEPTPPPPSAPALDKAGGSADDQLTYRWNQLGGQTVVEALAQVRDKVCGTQDAGKPGVKTL